MLVAALAGRRRVWWRRRRGGVRRHRHGAVRRRRSISALPSSSCTGIEYKGDGDPDVLIASDLPLQGSSRTQTIQIVEAIRYLLEQDNYKAGDHNVAYQSCDDATAQAGKWDSGKCSTNAQSYAANEKLVAVIGTFNSGCAADRDPGPEPGAGLAAWR